MICKFAYVEYSFASGNIISLKNTNIAYVKPHILKVKDNVVLSFLILHLQNVLKIMEKLLHTTQKNSLL